MELAATVIANHIVTRLAIPLFLAKADITGIESRPNHPVSTFDYKKFDYLVSILKDEIMGFSIIDIFNWDADLPGHRLSLIVFAEKSGRGIRRSQDTNG
jgi:hypothetical protein